MLRSMYSGISGMKGFQTKLDVIGNNIANVNTYGFKKGRMTFQDMMSQTISNSQGPVQDMNGFPLRGGKNAAQVGLGSQVGSIDSIHTQGNRQTTNRPLDLALEGDGMFVVAKGNANGPINGSSINLPLSDYSFSRAGNFYLDNEGYVVNANGKYLVGDVAKGSGQFIRLQIPGDAQSFSISNDGNVNYIDNQGQTQSAGFIQLAKFSNPSGLKKVGGNEFELTENAGLIDPQTGTTQNVPNFLATPGENGVAQVISGALEMSNVDLAEEFTEMITAQRGFQANTRIITTSDEILQELVNLKR